MSPSFLIKILHYSKPFILIKASSAFVSAGRSLILMSN